MLLFSDEETRARVYEIGQRGGGGVNTANKEWGVGELEFEALMRMLDNSVNNFLGTISDSSVFFQMHFVLYLQIIFVLLLSQSINYYLPDDPLFSLIRCILARK